MPYTTIVFKNLSLDQEGFLTQHPQVISVSHQDHFTPNAQQPQISPEEYQLVFNNVIDEIIELLQELKNSEDSPNPISIPEIIEKILNNTSSDKVVIDLSSLSPNQLNAFLIELSEYVEKLNGSSNSPHHSNT